MAAKLGSSLLILIVILISRPDSRLSDAEASKSKMKIKIKTDADATAFLQRSPRTQSPSAGSTNLRHRTKLFPMATEESDGSPLDSLWQEYALAFRAFDDLTLARWLAQTLGQLQGNAWRLSHPLLGAYRLGAQAAHDRQVWLKRLATPPAAYPESPCCRAPFLPLLTRDVHESGLLCQHCNEVLVPFDELADELKPALEAWAAKYAPVHAVAHWDDRQRKGAGNYDRAYDNAAKEAERLLAQAGGQLAPRLLDFYPAAVWEDQDECLDVRPEDVAL